MFCWVINILLAWHVRRAHVAVTCMYYTGAHMSLYCCEGLLSGSTALSDATENVLLVQCVELERVANTFSTDPSCWQICSDFLQHIMHLFVGGAGSIPKPLAKSIAQMFHDGIPAGFTPPNSPALAMVPEGEEAE